MTERALDAAQLLRIDYDAERAKLAESAFDATWRLAGELVRRAVRAGAARIVIRADAGALSVADDGRPPDAATLAAFATCRDASAAGALRHAALVLLEDMPGLAAASVWRRSTLETGAQTQVRLEGYRLDAAGRSALAEALRFCPASVSLDGVDLPRGHDGAFAEMDAPAPLRGRLGLGAVDVAEVALVLDGVVVARVTLPDAPPFAAWIDGTSLGDASRATPAGLREAVGAHARRLGEAAAGLALDSVARLPSLGENARSALLEVLLACARLGLRRGDVLSAPVLPALVNGRPEHRSLLDLGRHADAAGSVLALDPSRDVCSALLPEATVYVLDGENRARIAALLDVRFRPVPARTADASFESRRRRAILGAHARLRETMLRLWPGAGRPLDEDELDPAERGLLRALGAGVSFSAGAGSVRQAAGSWRLPRGAGLVRRAVSAVASDGRWRYVASLALFQERRELPAGWAEEWRRP